MSEPKFLSLNYGTGFEVFTALIRASGAGTKKNSAQRLSGGGGAVLTITVIYCYCLLGGGPFKEKPPRRAALKAD